MNTAVDSKLKRNILYISIISSFIVPFIGSSINVALPTIGSELKMNAITLSWIATIYLLTSAVFLVPFGKLADIKGRKKIYLTGIVIFTVSSTFCGISGNSVFLLIFRALQGVGSAMMFSTGMAILTSIYPAKERGKALGINASSVYIGLSLGPFLGGFLTQHLGWRSIFFILVPIGLLLFLLVITKLKGEWKDNIHHDFDIYGSIFYGISLVFLIYGFSKLPELNGFILTFGGIILIFVFISFELKQKYPVVELSLFKKNKIFRYSNLSALINYSATFALVFLLSLYFQYIRKYSPRETGIFLITQPVIMAVFSPVTGKLSDRIEARYLSSIGMAISAIGLLIFVFLNANTPIIAIIFNLIIIGMGLALFASPNNNAIMSSIDKKHYGVGSAMLGTMRLIGQMLSMGIAVMILSIFIGKSNITPENSSQFLMSIKVTFLIFSVLCFSGIFASMARGNNINN
jgi:EmrB/QacA subfamily drug resistance transporter